MTDKARMFRRVSSTLRYVEADVGVQIPGHRGLDHAIVETEVYLIDDVLHVQVHVLRLPERESLWLKERKFTAKDLISDEWREIT